VNAIDLTENTIVSDHSNDSPGILHYIHNLPLIMTLMIWVQNFHPKIDYCNVVMYQLLMLLILIVEKRFSIGLEAINCSRVVINIFREFQFVKH
jgi:hypothetical protein